MSNQFQVELDQIKTMVEQMAVRISAPSSLLPTFGSSEDMGRPHVEVDADGYHLIVVEKGAEQYRTTTKSRDDLMFELFRNVASAMAFEFEMNQMPRAVDPRSVAFAKAISILSALNADWAQRQKRHYEEVLSTSPLRT
ncbi:Imm63 family immunity protein [Paraburkholderia sartisoli]|uniref:Imm63 family immunity protein n=1 Tax=Paraburkholderia sartisoli TaxID=83784 RepID=UPI000B823E36|nr:Imm63 family immunity protein [Paraburkholderia sartisoli]